MDGWQFMQHNSGVCSRIEPVDKRSEDLSMLGQQLYSLLVTLYARDEAKSAEIARLQLELANALSDDAADDEAIAAANQLAESKQAEADAAKAEVDALKSALAEQDADEAKLQALIEELQAKLNPVEPTPVEEPVADGSEEAPVE